MDELTHKTGIDAQGRRIHGSVAEPTQGERHENRMRRAAATMNSPPGRLELREVIAEDGRHAYPDVVQYRLRRWVDAAQDYVPTELVDLPPTAETHPDDHAEELARKAGNGFLPTSVPYEAVVHDLGAYDRLKACGLLDVGHRLPPAAVPEVIDNRAAPGA